MTSQIQQAKQASPTFRFAGIPITVQLSFVVATALFAMQRTGVGILVWVVVCFVSVLIHELGHALLIRRFGGEPSILLYMGGGLTFGNRRETPWRSLLVSLAGPAAGFAFALFAFALASVLPKTKMVDLVLEDLLWVNVGWGIFNLLPMLPLDGGNAFEALVALRWPERSRFAAEIATAVSCLAVVGASIVMRLYFPILLALWWTQPTWRALYERFERFRDRATTSRLNELRLWRRGGKTQEARERGRELIAQARTTTLRRSVAEELVMCELDARNVTSASALVEQRLVGAEISRATYFALELAQNGAAAEIDRLEQEVKSTDCCETFGVFLDACAELDDYHRGVRVIYEHARGRISFPALFSRIIVHFNHKRYELALTLCEIGTLSYPTFGVFPYNAACCLSHLGRRDEAFAALERALEASDGATATLQGDPDLRSLQGDERWAILIARVGAAPERTTEPAPA